MWRSLGLAVSLIVSLGGCASPNSSSSRRTATASTNAVAVVFQQGLTIRCVRHETNPKRLFVEVEGLGQGVLQALRQAPMDASAWVDFFAVYVDGLGGQDVPAIQGRYEILEDRVRFEPQFPMQGGLRYRVLVSPAKIPGQNSQNFFRVTVSFSIPAPSRVPKTVVRAVYPSADRLPENLLKFYIHFSGAMTRGGSYQQIRLLDATGKEVKLPFLEVGEELWNPELTRLTLLFDPGRIKRGVLPREELGPSIEAGKRYTLVVDANWRDSDGAPLKATYRKSFFVLPPDREPPEIETWSLRAPDSETRGLLVLRFPEPMDDALAQRLIWVVDAESHRVAGKVTMTNEERTWTFLPEQPWAEGRYQVIADTILEDLAGNNIGKPFDVDVFERVEEKPTQNTVSIDFEVKPR